MKKFRLASAATFLIVALVLLCGLFATSANAAVDPTATALLFTYYDVRGLSEGGLGVTDNYFTVINSSSAWTQAHVRVRTGDCSVELLDFDVMLSPNDVFAFDLSQDGDGIAFSSKDAVTIANSKELAPFLTTLPDGSEGIAFSSNPSSAFYTPNLTSLILTCGTCPNRGAITDADANRATLKGYVEVIMEGQIKDCATTTNPSDPKHGYCRPTEAGHYVNGVSCASIVDNLVDIRKHTLFDLTKWFNQTVFPGGNGLCSKSVEKVHPELSGRVYYASVSPDFSDIPRLAHINAEALDSNLPAAFPVSGKHIIIHDNTYQAELVSARCLVGAPVETCYAYSEATTNSANELNDESVGGADDMNYCFYQDLVDVDGQLLGVRNKFGAAATFGPTIADIGLSVSRRNGLLLNTRASLLTNLEGSSVWNYAYNGLNPEGPRFLKQEVHSHFFFSPAPADFDIKTALAFIFPFKHFINEKPQLGSIVYHNMDEEPCTAPQGGFISPGLPGQLETTEEAFLEYLTANCGYAEGWVHIGDITAKNETQMINHCTIEGLPRTAGNQYALFTCETFGLQPISHPLSSEGPYIPGWTGAVFILGPESLSSSLLQVHGERPFLGP